jgi:hypothetical protein
MTNEQINIAIAELCGLDVIQNPHGSKDLPEAWKTGFFTPKAAKQRRLSWPSSAIVKVIPDYCKCLNAMHKALMTLNDGERFDFLWHLNDMGIVAGYFEFIILPPEVLAEAFLRTLGKWEE